MRNRPQRTNNPLNLRFAHQTEAVGKDKDGFAVFPFWEAGFRAAHAQIRLDASRGLTLAQFIEKFAPPSENDTENYIDFICDEMRCGPLTMLDSLSPYALAGVMAQMEGAFAR